MANPRMDVATFVGKLLEEEDVDLLREGVRVLVQTLMETEVSSQIGAAPSERSGSRSAYRNGCRTRTWDTRVGTIELKIPKVTAGSYFPSLLEPRRRAEKALHAVICEAYVKGISTRKVDDLVRALGMDGHLEVGGLRDLQGPGRRGGCVPGPPVGRRALVRVARRHLPQDPGARTGGLGSHRGRGGGLRDRRAPCPRVRHRPV